MDSLNVWTVVWTELVAPWPLFVGALLVGSWFVWDLGQAVGEELAERIGRALRG